MQARTGFPRRGSIIVPLLILATIVGIVLASAMSMMFPVLKSKGFYAFNGSMLAQIGNFRQCVQEDAAWQYTVTDKENATAMACLLKAAGCPNGNKAKIRLRSALATNDFCVPGYDSLDPKMGFSDEGRVCSTFTTEGNSACPYRVEFTWKTFCQDGIAICAYPIEWVVGNILFSPTKGSDMRPPNIGDGIKWPDFDHLMTFSILRGTNSDKLPVVLYETQPAGVAGGACPAGSTVTRKINGIQTDLGGSVAALNPVTGIFTLHPGIYECRFSVPGMLMASFQTKFIDVTTGVSLILGNNQFAPNMVGGSQTRSEGAGRLDLKGDTRLALQQTCQEAPGYPNPKGPGPYSADLAMGVPSGIGVEIYSVIHCRQVVKRL